MSQPSTENKQNKEVSRETSSQGKALGRGLENLLGPSSSLQSVEKKGGLAMLPVSVLSPGTYQPRRKFDPKHLSELVESVRENGVLQPILVRPTGEMDKFQMPLYEIIAGERRWRASQQAGRKTIPVVIRHLTDKQALESGLIENIQRDDLNAMEEAAGYDRLMAEFKYTQETLAKMIGKSRSHIANTLRLLGLSQTIKGLVESKALSAGHARALLTCDRADEFSAIILRENLSVRQTERMIGIYNEAPFEPADYSAHLPTISRASPPKNPSSRSKPSRSFKGDDILSLESELSKAVGLKSKIEMKEDQSGHIQIHFKNPNELDKVMNLIFGTL